MPHHAAARRSSRIRRRTFTARILGLAHDRSTDSLKQYLHEAQLTASPDTKLDLVMLTDVEHFEELLAEHGVPLARADIPPEHDPAPPVMHVRIDRAAALLTLAGISILDDAVRVLTQYALLPF